MSKDIDKTSTDNIILETINSHTMSERPKHSNNSTLKNRIAGLLALTACLGTCETDQSSPPAQATRNDVANTLRPDGTGETHDLQWRINNVPIVKGESIDCYEQELKKNYDGEIECSDEPCTLADLTAPPSFPLIWVKSYIMGDAIENTKSDPELQLEVIRRTEKFGWYTFQHIKTTEGQLEALPKFSFYLDVWKIDQVRDESIITDLPDRCNVLSELLALLNLINKTSSPEVLEKALEISGFWSIEEVESERRRIFDDLSEREKENIRSNSRSFVDEMTELSESEKNQVPIE